jgi:hypothetical protein
MFYDIIPVTFKPFNIFGDTVLSISTSCPPGPHSIPLPLPTTSYSSSPLSAPPQIKHLIDALDIN